MAGLDDSVRDGYLRRLGLATEPPAVDALFRLHRAHVERVAWETIWIHLGEAWSIDPVASAQRIGATGRGGYCFHLNGAFHRLLVALGYRATRHVATVHRPGEPEDAAMDDHLTVTVNGLPTEANPGGQWLVDVGLASGPREPLALLPGTDQHGPFRFDVSGLGPGDADDGWRLSLSPVRGWEAITWRAVSASMLAFEERHAWLSQSPDSRFVQYVNVQRWDADGPVALRGITLSRLGTDDDPVELASRTELVDTLTDHFALDLSAVPAVHLDRLWVHAVRAHEAWVVAGRP